MEHLNHMLVEWVHAVLHVSRLPKTLWGEVISHIVWVKNRSATWVLNGKMLPYEMMYGKKPDLANLPEWGSRCWVHDMTGSKLDARVHKARWVGFDLDTSNAHRVYFTDR